jgi:hypothetical protein
MCGRYSSHVGYTERSKIRGRWLHAVGVALGGRGYCWPPLPLIGACRHGPFAHVALERLSNFKLKFQTHIFEIVLWDKDNFLRLMFAYTTSDVYLTLMFKLEIYSKYS